MVADGEINLNGDLKSILQKINAETAEVLEDDRIAGLK